MADTTFLLNRNVTVANGLSTAPSSPFEALIRVRQSAFARTYTIKVEQGASTWTATYLTPDGSTANSGKFVDTDNIAAILLDATALGAIPDNGSATSTLGADLAGAGFTVTQVGAVIAISHPSTDFTVEVTDGQAGEALVPIKDEVQDFSDLPKTAVDGFKVKVTNTQAGTEDDYYVVFDSTAGPTGTWKETIAPSVNLGVNPATLPVIAQYNTGSSTWEIDVGPWQGRSVGDLLLSPDPGFIGFKLTDITFWRGRLGIIYDEDIHFASAADPYQLYISTLVTSVESDPFTLQSPLDERSSFRNATAFNKRLIIFSELAQFTVDSDPGVVSPSSTSIDVATRYRSSDRIDPQGANSKLYFVAERGPKASIVYEMDIDRVTDTEQADDLTFHVPSLLPVDLDIATSSPTEFVTCYGKSGSRDWYIHLYRHAEKERIQNGWFPCQLPAGFTMVAMLFIGTELHVFSRDSSTGYVHLSRMSFAPNQLDDDASSRILTHLDFRRDETEAVPVYDGVTDTTTIPLLYPGSALVRVITRAPGGSGGKMFGGTLETLYEGQPANVVSFTSSTVVVDGDWSSVPFYVGYAYDSRWRANRFYAKDQTGSVIRNGRLTIRRLLIDVSDSGFQSVEVTAGGRPTRIRDFEGYRYGDSESIVGMAPSVTTELDIAVACTNDQLVVEFSNDSHFPSRVTGYEWIGEFSPKAGRIG